jgi:hypothetical protein
VLHSSLNIRRFLLFVVHALSFFMALSLHEFSVLSFYSNLCFQSPLPDPILCNGFSMSFIRALLILQWPVRHMFRCYFLLHSSKVAVLFRRHNFYVCYCWYEVTSISSRSISFLTPFSRVTCRHMLGAKFSYMAEIQVFTLSVESIQE